MTSVFMVLSFRSLSRRAKMEMKIAASFARQCKKPSVILVYGFAIPSSPTVRSELEPACRMSVTDNECDRL